MQNFHNLEVYKLSKALTVDIIKELDNVQVSFRLKEQLICAVNSIASNLAEMSAYDSKNSQIQKVHICLGECNETENDIDVLHESGKLDIAKHRNFIERVRTLRKMLLALLKSMGWESHSGLSNGVTGDKPPRQYKNRYQWTQSQTPRQQQNSFPYIRGRAGN